MKSVSLIIAFLAVIAFALPAQAVLWTFDPIFLDGLQEVPPNASPGTGTGTATLDDVTGIMSVSGSFTGLVSPTIDAHVHCCAVPGVNAGVLFGLTFTPAATSGTFSASSTPLSPAQIANVLNGLSYVNIHSQAFTGGEIRGQILNPVPEPAACLSLGLSVIGIIALRRRRR